MIICDYRDLKNNNFTVNYSMAEFSPAMELVLT